MKSIFLKIISVSAVIAATVFLFFTATFAHAAVIRITPSATSTALGQPVQFNVTLDTGGIAANTIQAAITFPADLFTLQLINTGNSLVSFWITPPEQSSSGEIDLAGIIPGGFNGSSGSIVSLVLQPLAVGTAEVNVATATVLANDGLGSSVPVTVSGAHVVIAESGGTIPAAPPHSLITPENFMPQIEQDPNVYDGHYFLVFQAVDKGTGIDHYEVMEVPTGNFGWGFSWHTAQSPYLLQDQSLSSDIYVRAVDHAGNFIVVEVPARHPVRRPGIGIVDMLIVLIVVVVAWCIWLFKRKRRP